MPRPPRAGGERYEAIDVVLVPVTGVKSVRAELLECQHHAAMSFNSNKSVYRFFYILPALTCVRTLLIVLVLFVNLALGGFDVTVVWMI